MTSPNRLKIYKLFDQAHSKSDLVKVSCNFAIVFAAMKWEWKVSTWDSYKTYIPNHSHIYQTIKDLLIELKKMVDDISGPIRQTDDFSMSTGRIKCRIFYMDNEWHLTVDLIYNGSEFVA